MKQKFLRLCITALMMLITTDTYAVEINGIAYNLNTEAKTAKVSYGSRGFGAYSGSIIIPPNITVDGVQYKVTGIGGQAFYNCSSLTTITLPSSITTIEVHAFDGCKSLTAVNITDLEAWCKIDFSDNPLSYAHHLFLNGEEIKDLVIPESVTNIKDRAFYGCESLTSLKLPESVTTIGRTAFYGCKFLSSVIIPESVTTIGRAAFYGCKSLTTINIPESVTSIKEETFANCTSLTSINLPKFVTSIGDRAFQWCESLTSITFPESVTSIGAEAFYYCSSLTTSINLSESVTSIGYQAFYGCTAPIAITLPNTVTRIEDYAFSESGLTSITIPYSVTSIGNSAFEFCSLLTSINIPESVTSIGESAFLYCTSLTTITIPSSVTHIEDYAFEGCENILDIYSYNPIPPICGYHYNIPSTAKLHVPQGAKKAYASASTWQKFRIIEDINPEEDDDDDSDINIASNGISVNDKNGDNRVSISDATFTIGATQQGESYTTDDIEVVTKHILGKRNVIVVWLSSSKQDRYYFNNVPTIRYDGDNIQIEKADGSEKVYTSDDILRITYDYMPVQDTHEYVDLGLPSGTLWATCNVGANSPEEYGDYFAWGEVVTKGYYDRSTYKYNDKDYQTSLTKYNIESSKGVVDDKTELDIEDDAAYVHWSAGWRIPSREQQEELLDKNNCTWTWTTQNSINGHLVTSMHNGNSIFLPAAGYYIYGELSNVGNYGYYWSRSLYMRPDYTKYPVTEKAYNLYFDTRSTPSSTFREIGLPVRPVRQ